MSYHHRSVCVSLLDRSLHKAALEHTTNRLWLDGRGPDRDPPWLLLEKPDGSELTAVSISLAVDGRGKAYLGLISHSPGDAWLIRQDGTKIHIAQTPGAGNIKLRARSSGVEVYVQETDGIGGPVLPGVRVYDEDGELLRVYDVPYAAEGVHAILDDGTPVMGNERSLNGKIEGVSFWKMVEHNGARAAQGGVGPIGGVILLVPGQPMQAVLGETQHPVELAYNGTTAWVAVSGPNWPEPDEMPWMTWPPVAVDPPVVTPPIVVPPVPPVVTPPVVTPPVPPVVVPPVVVPPTPPVIVPPVVTPPRQPRWLRNLLKWLGW